MIPTVSDIAGIIECYAPPSGAESWDNSGLQIGDPDARVETTAVALDADEQNVSLAADRGARLLITHHPLIFPDIRSVDLRTGVGRTIADALKGNLSIYCAHTNLDHAALGTSRVLAGLLDLEDISPSPDAGRASETTATDGIIVLGRPRSRTSLADLGARAKTALGASAIRIVGEGARSISLAAVCAGSGGDFITTATRMGADVLITGEVRYHAAVRARDTGLCLIEAGHFWSEMPVVRETARIIAEEARKRDWDLSVFTIEGRDPFTYL